MTTCAEIIRDAMQRNQFLEDGEYPTPNQEAGALRKLQAIILGLPGMSQWIDVEVSADYTAGEDERVRVITTDAVTITIPVAVSSAEPLLWCCNQITLKCEGYADRAPRDGSRVAVADAYSDDHATYFYRADLAQWVRADDLARDSTVPLNADMDESLTDQLCVTLAAGDPRHTLHPLVAQHAIASKAKMRARYGRRKEIAGDLAQLNTLAQRRYYNWPN